MEWVRWCDVVFGVVAEDGGRVRWVSVCKMGRKREGEREEEKEKKKVNERKRKRKRESQGTLPKKKKFTDPAYWNEYMNTEYRFPSNKKQNSFFLPNPARTSLPNQYIIPRASSSKVSPIITYTYYHRLIE